MFIAGYQPRTSDQGMGSDQTIEGITSPRQPNCTMRNCRPGISSDDQPKIRMQCPDDFIGANSDAFDFLQESQFKFDHRRNGELLLLD